MAIATKMSVLFENPKTRRNFLALWLVLNIMMTLIILSPSHHFVSSTEEGKSNVFLGHLGGLVSDLSATSHEPQTANSIHDDKLPAETDDQAAGSHGTTAEGGHGEAMVTESTSPGTLLDDSSGEKFAFLIETRIIPNAIPLILHFSAVLGPSWQIIFYTMESEWSMPASIPFRRAIDEHRVQVRYLPSDTNFTTHNAVSEFLTRPWLWEQFQDAYRVLLFQTDSIICANSERTVEEFLQYDFVGAPINPAHGRGFNGGLSIRNPRLMLDITKNETFTFMDDFKSGRQFLQYEDQWFYTKLLELGTANIPSDEIAGRFCSETIYYETPLGYHQPQRWHSDHMEELQRHCPEIGMLIGNRY